MPLTLGAILALLSVAVAVYPFIRDRFFGASANGTADSSGKESGGKTPEHADALESIYDAIRTLQLERELGNIPEGLYREQFNGYRMQAALILRQRDGVRGGEKDLSLEEEIKLARTGLYNPSSGGFACSNCTRPVPAGNDNCPECGVGGALAIRAFRE